MNRKQILAAQAAQKEESEEEREEKKSQEKQGVWTSNSDLFMAIAVVFLIMFVFAMIAAQIQKAEVVNENIKKEKFQEGKIPEQQIAQEKKDKIDLVASITNINDQQKIIKKDLKFMAKLSETLQDKKKLFLGLQAKHSKRNKELKTASVKIDQQKVRIAHLEEDLTEKSKKLKISQKKMATQSTTIEKEDSQIKKLTTEGRDKDNAIKSLSNNKRKIERKMAKQAALIKAYKAKLEKDNQKIAKLNQRIEENNTKIQNKQSLTGEIEENIGRFENSLAESTGKGKSLSSQLSDQKGRYNKLMGKLDQTSKQLGSASNEVGKFKDQGDQLQEGIKGQEIKNIALQKKAKKSTNKLEKISLELEKAKQQLDNREQSIAALNEELKKIQNNDKILANRIGKDMQDAGIELFVDPQSGMLILRLDNSFLFKRNSSELTEMAKSKVKEILPKYANSLFSDRKTRARISTVSITGYASPRFKGKYVDPFVFESESYNYNLELSYRRAQEVASYIFGNEIGDFPHKQTLRTKAQVSGKGYMSPIKAESENSVEDKAKCGEYNCSKSRRVEISFLLKPSQGKAKPNQLIGH